MEDEKVNAKELDLFDLIDRSATIEREQASNMATASTIANGASATINNRLRYPPEMQPECTQGTPSKWLVVRL